MSAREESRALVPALGVTLLLPVPLLNFVADGAGRAFAFAYLFFGCALVAAECFRPGSSGHWGAKMTALSAAMAIAVTTFCVCYWAVSGDPDAGVVVLAVLAAVPALCVVPYLVLLDGRPYVAVAFAALLLVGVKLTGCVVARLVYGPTALADGQMAMSWREPNLLVWFCLVGGMLVSSRGGRPRTPACHVTVAGHSVVSRHKRQKAPARPVAGGEDDAGQPEPVASPTPP
ncbi:MAG: hypothetical protein JWO38_6336 [Gemmataceae bacterium]|nr:hypothetical protein [Gemmataceae bacterium]